MFWFELVRIRPLRLNWTIAEPWDEGDGFEWAKVNVTRVAEPDCRMCHPGAMPRWWPSGLQPSHDHHCRGTTT